jgi:hypothetical protein
MKSIARFVLMSLVAGLAIPMISHAQAQPMLIAYDQENTGVTGGSAPANNWIVRKLNVVNLNTIPGATLDVTTSTITLPPGTYSASASAPAFAVDKNNIKIYGGCGGPYGGQQIWLVGPNNYANSVYAGAAVATAFGVYTCSTTSTLQVQHFTQTAKSSNGLGVAMSDPNNSEIYTQLTIIKLN